MSERRFQKRISHRESIERSIEENENKPKRNLAAMSRKERHAELERRKYNERLTDTVMETDPFEKALTGRTPEIIEQETGIPQQEMFPPNMDILYVGDPWQRMGKILDNEHMHIVDYEYGESASFITDKKGFLEEVVGHRKNNADTDEENTEPTFSGGIEGHILNEIHFLNPEKRTEEEKIFLKTFSELVSTAARLSEKAAADPDNYENYGPAADAWLRAKTFLEETYRTEQENKEVGDSNDDDDNWEMSRLRTQAWYDTVKAERGFRDIPDYEQIVKPELEKLKTSLYRKGFDYATVHTKVREKQNEMIRDLRFVKKPKHAHVDHGTFPDLPYDDESFDRFIASWSISAHTFAEFSENDFAQSWNEIDRLLRERGVAYIFPLNFSGIDDSAFMKSLEAFAEKSGLKYSLLNHVGEEVKEFGDAHTLKLTKEYSRDFVEK